MKKLNSLALVIIFLQIIISNIALASVPVQALAKATGQEVPSLAPMLSEVTPAVVNISTRSLVTINENPLLQDPFFRRFFDLPTRPRKREAQSLGSGVLVDAEQGYIITNNHVIDKADEITVTLRDNRKLIAKLIGKDAETDIAVIQVKAEKLTAVSFADSEQLRVGDYVVAIGNPFGLGQTVTSGIVSALGRSGLGIEGYEDFIQTDASINPGNSGGALVNLKGELVGINTAILSPGGSGNIGIGFAIPINMAKDIMQQLIEFGEVKRGRLGVFIQDLTEDLAKAFNLSGLEGVVVSQIMPNSPAESAGLKAGDIIVSVNDRAVTNSSDLRNIIGLLRVGRKVNLEIIRNGKKRSITAVVTEQEQAKIEGGKISAHLSGAMLAIVEEDGNLRDRLEGIQVVKVEQNSAAWNAGLRKGDIIISANRILVKNFNDLRTAVERSRRGLLLNIQRGDGGLFLLIQ